MNDNEFADFREINVWDIREGTYLISPIGDIYCIDAKKYMKPTIKDKTLTYPGQKYVLLRTNDPNKRKWFTVARLVNRIYNGEPPADMKNPSTDHIDSNPFNNYYKNLRWIEHGINSIVRRNRGIGEANSRAIFTEQDVKSICNLLIKKIMTVKEIAKKYGVSPGTIDSIKRGKNWSYISRWFEFE